MHPGIETVFWAVKGCVDSAHFYSFTLGFREISLADLEALQNIL
jgi:hypothetical protein